MTHKPVAIEVINTSGLSGLQIVKLLHEHEKFLAISLQSAFVFYDEIIKHPDCSEAMKLRCDEFAKFMTAMAEKRFEVCGQIITDTDKSAMN
jgi:hypothetical protein